VLSTENTAQSPVATLRKLSYCPAPLARFLLAWEQRTGGMNEESSTVEARREGPIAPGMRVMDEEDRQWKG